MFCIKVTPGKERSTVHQYSSGFLPTYTPASRDATASKIPGKIKKLIIPGYIFTLTKTREAVPVDDWEWELIEALSSNSISSVNKRGQVVDGPLKGLDEYVAAVDLRNSVATIKARLLGEYRTFNIPVAIATASQPQPEQPEQPEQPNQDEEQKPDDEKGSTVVELKKSTVEKETGKMSKITYTEDQLNAALDRAAEIGIHKAAAENGVSWQSLQAYAKKMGKLDEVSLKKKAKPATTEPTATEPATTEPTVDEEKVGKKTAKPRTKKAAKPAAEAATPSVEEEKAEPAEPVAASALEIENAVLKAENEQLKAKIEKLQKALADLI